jgi:cytochrome b
MSEPAKGSPGTQQVQVWDAAVRVFHWLLVALIAFMWWSGKQKGDWFTYHFYAGYTVCALIIFRIVWGFVGGTHARFSDFLYGPRAIIAYLKTLPSRTAAKFAGHNPLGGWSVVLMILCVTVQVSTGLFANNDDTAMEGPLAKWVSGSTSNLLTSIHRINFNVLLALMAVHIGAVVYYLVYKKENLISPMFSGRKHLPPAIAGAERHSGGWARALTVLVIVAVGVYFLVR